MLAPPQRRRKHKPIAVLRADARRRKTRQLEREKRGLHRCVLWVSGRAIEGLIRQFMFEGRLTDKAALDHHNFETALAALIEKQGAHWSR